MVYDIRNHISRRIQQRAADKLPGRDTATTGKLTICSMANCIAAGSMLSN